MFLTMSLDLLFLVLEFLPTHDFLVHDLAPNVRETTAGSIESVKRTIWLHQINHTPSEQGFRVGTLFFIKR
jgi:hypothetical protein